MAAHLSGQWILAHRFFSQSLYSVCVPTQVRETWLGHAFFRHCRNISATVSEQRFSCFDFYTYIIVKIFSSVFSFISTCSSIMETACTYTIFFSELQMCHHNCSYISSLFFFSLSRNSCTFMAFVKKLLCVYILTVKMAASCYFFPRKHENICSSTFLNEEKVFELFLADVFSVLK